MSFTFSENAGLRISEKIKSSTSFSPCAAKWQGGGTSAIGQEAEVTDAHETFREQMQREAAQELIDR
jgi:hypothetical protein